jgi:hypothetical protein
MKKRVQTKRRKRLGFDVKEHTKKFFPPVSPMGSEKPIPYTQPKPVEVQRIGRECLYSNTTSSPITAME